MKIFRNFVIILLFFVDFLNKILNLDDEMEIKFVLNWFKNMLLIESEVNFLMDYMVIEIVIVVVILLIIMIICLVGNVVICYVVFCNR